KSVTAQTIMGILDMPPGFITGGAIRYKGNDLLKMPEKDRRKIRGAEISMIFQDSLSALNPVFTVGDQISEMFQVHRGMSKKEGMARAVDLMDQVRIPAAKERVKDYPHQFSGGMRQRIMIAMAISLDPAVLIADEPTTALDVTVQAQIMELLQDLQRERNMGMILITHDLGVVAGVADKIAVMYSGRIVESADVLTLYAKPAHPYTQGLLDSMPRVDTKGEELYAIKGLPPSLLNLPPGCNFNPRCPHKQQLCLEEVPDTVEVAPGHQAACHFWKEVARG
nr:ABC transporter ATP-binding protein [Candidatus Nanopelagicales bacterium]